MTYVRYRKKKKIEIRAALQRTWKHTYYFPVHPSLASLNHSAQGLLSRSVSPFGSRVEECLGITVHYFIVLPSITSYDAISLFDFPQVFSMSLPAIIILHNQLFEI